MRPLAVIVMVASSLISPTVNLETVTISSPLPFPLSGVTVSQSPPPSTDTVQATLLVTETFWVPPSALYSNEVVFTLR